MLHILPFLSGCCSKTEVSEQLYSNFLPARATPLFEAVPEF
jgi:hypothetical protein